LQRTGSIAVGRQIVRVSRILQQNKVADDPFRGFGEWDSQADNKAYANL
jgi:hypothetical protein